jgi:hypothetical protein
MEGLAYQHVRAVAPLNTNHVARIEQHDSWDHLREIFINNVNFSADAYESLEAYFRRVGEHHLADAVYIHRKQEELKDRDMYWPRKMWSHVLYWFVGYGKRPEKALIWSLGIVVFGSVFVFRPSKMCRKEDKGGNEDAPEPAQEKNLRCNSFWYSLDLFAPAIDLHVADAWNPEIPVDPFPEQGRYGQVLWHLHRWRWYYVRIHKTIGWILIPLGLAAVLGIVK